MINRKNIAIIYSHSGKLTKFIMIYHILVRIFFLVNLFQRDMAVELINFSTMYKNVFLNEMPHKCLHLLNSYGGQNDDEMYQEVVQMYQHLKYLHRKLNYHNILSSIKREKNVLILKGHF